MHTVLEQIGRIGIVPVIKIDEGEKAVPLAQALLRGGIPCAEITFRTAQGEEAIRRIAREVPEMLVGAGTVLTTDQVDRAVDAGAKFVVSPGFNPKVVARCVEKGVPMVPGCACPSDMEKALELGLDVVKFFPAEQAGGLDYMRAVAAPYPTLRFIPTGGINGGNIARYLAFDRVLACGGSWMVDAELVRAGRFDQITALCKEAVRSMLGFTLMHISIYGDDGAQVAKAAGLFEMMFGPASGEDDSSLLAAGCIGVVRKPAPDKRGNITIGSCHVARAQAFLERQGFAFRAETAQTDAKGKLAMIQMENEIFGFEVHLAQA